jgi:hypothetical protein
MEGYILSSCFTIFEGSIRILTVLSNTLLGAIEVPSKQIENRMEQISDTLTKPMYRKIDRGMNLVMSNMNNGDIYVCGEDKFLKKYEYPNELINKIDFKKPPNPPVEEHKSHDLMTTCYDFSNEIKFMVTGSKDGNFILRNMNSVA